MTGLSKDQILILLRKKELENKQQAHHISCLEQEASLLRDNIRILNEDMGRLRRDIDDIEEYNES